MTTNTNKYEANPLRNLHPRNYIIRNCEFMKTQYDGYGDWNLIGALQNLAIISNKKIRLELSQGTIYPNIWALGLGNSSTSRKSTAMRKHSEFHCNIGLLNHKLSDSFSPERFIEEMSEESHKYFWKDECAGLIASINKKNYMADMRDLLMDMYECGDFKRSLRTSRSGEKTEFEANNIFLNMWWMTTPENFEKYITSLDFASGLILRFLVSNPETEKGWMGYREKTDDDKKGWNELLNTLYTLNQLITVSPLIEMKLTKDSWIYWNEWQERREKETEKDRMLSSIFSRLENYAMKISMLFTLGKHDFTLEKNDKYKDQLMCYIEKNELEVACELIDKYFLPNAVKLTQNVEECIEMKQIKKIEEFIYKYGKVTKSDILRNVRLPSKLATPAISHLLESGEIYVKQDNIKQCMVDFYYKSD